MNLKRLLWHIQSSSSAPPCWNWERDHLILAGGSSQSCPFWVFFFLFLSFSYLTFECASAALTVGKQKYLGFLKKKRSKKANLLTLKRIVC